MFAGEQSALFGVEEKTRRSPGFSPALSVKRSWVRMRWMRSRFLAVHRRMFGWPLPVVDSSARSR